MVFTGTTRDRGGGDSLTERAFTIELFPVHKIMEPEGAGGVESFRKIAALCLIVLLGLAVAVLVNDHFFYIFELSVPFGQNLYPICSGKIFLFVENLLPYLLLTF